MTLQGVSIIICCHNGSQRLPETIRHIARQVVPPYIPWEFLLINNGSTDDTVAVARAEWKKYNKDTYLKIIHEPMIGLSYARLRAFKEARYEYMVLCDDDNWLAEDYVFQVYNIMSERRSVAALGGFGKLAYEVEPPVAELSYIFAAGEQAPRSGKVMENKVYGAGCVIRQSAYQKLLEKGFKSLLTDRRGTELSSGGDYELCLALAISGYDIWYDERLRFTHFITRERLTWAYFLRYASESSKSFNVISSYKMVAGTSVVKSIPLMVILKNFLLTTKTFIGINAKLLTARQPCLRKSLYFRHVIYKYKLLAYLTKFFDMVNTHRHILNFQQSCAASPNYLRSPRAKVLVPSFKLSFFSKPSRQLQ